MNEPIGIIAVLREINRRFQVAGNNLPVPVLAKSTKAESRTSPDRLQDAVGEARESTPIKAASKGQDSRGGQFICLGQIVAAEAQVSGDEAAGSVLNSRTSAAPEQSEGPEFSELTRAEQQKLAPNNEPEVD